jgi:hypothetical protein
MLILMEPPEQPLREAKPPVRRRRDYIAVIAVVVAIVVSLAGVALVILEASADPPPRIGQSTLA